MAREAQAEQAVVQLRPSCTDFGTATRAIGSIEEEFYKEVDRGMPGTHQKPTGFEGQKDDPSRP